MSFVTLFSGASPFAASGGDVVGPASSTLNAITTYADTSGKLLANTSGVILLDGEFTPDSSPIVINFNLSTIPFEINSSSTITFNPSYIIFKNNSTAVTSNILIDSVVPEGAVSAPTGSLYLYNDGVGGTLYVKSSDSGGNTGWVDALSGAGAGDVTGPVSATDNALALFDGATGKIIKNSSIQLSGTNFSTTNPANDINFLTDTGSFRVTVTGAASGNIFLLTASGNLTFSAASGEVLLQGGGSSYQLISSNTEMEINSGVDILLKSPITRLNNDGLSLNADLLLTNATPEGALTAYLGSLAIYNNGTNAELYLKESGNLTNTGWQLLGGGGSGDVTGPASATDNALALFDGTTGKIIKNSSIELSGINFSTTTPSDNINFVINTGNFTISALGSGGIDFAIGTGDLTFSSSVGSITVQGGGSSYQLISTASELEVNSSVDILLKSPITRLNNDSLSLNADLLLTNVNPEGNVTAYLGSLAIYNTGASASIYIKETGNLTNTGWALLENGTGSGDVVGPASATDNALSLFDGGTGKVIKNSLITLDTYTFQSNDSNGITFSLTSTQLFDIQTVDGNIVMNTLNGSLDFTSIGSGNWALSLGTGNINYNFNSIPISIYIKNALPNGVYTGTQGDLLHYNDGTQGSLYIKESGTATNTGWGEVVTNTTVVSLNSDTVFSDTTYRNKTIEGTNITNMNLTFNPNVFKSGDRMTIVRIGGAAITLIPAVGMTLYSSFTDDPTDATILTRSYSSVIITFINPTSAMVVGDITPLKYLAGINTGVGGDIESLDIGNFIECTSASNVTFTIKEDSVVELPIGASIKYMKGNTGNVTINADGGVTFDGGPVTLTTLYEWAEIVKVAANRWALTK